MQYGRPDGMGVAAGAAVAAGAPVAAGAAVGAAVGGGVTTTGTGVGCGVVATGAGVDTGGAGTAPAAALITTSAQVQNSSGHASPHTPDCAMPPTEPPSPLQPAHAGGKV